jgi:hypothetical protein
VATGIHLTSKKMKTIATFLLAFTAVTASVAQEHPAYLHALSNLRAARWMIDHRPGNWVASVDETAAVREIDQAINEIKLASIDDGKNVNDHPQDAEIPQRPGRLTKAIEWLRKARTEIEQHEDNDFAKGLRRRAFQHIDEAIRLTEKARQA